MRTVFIAITTAAFAAALSLPAEAALTNNALTSNGTSLNALTSNGTSLNALTSNGTSLNALTSNGTSLNALTANGTAIRGGQLLKDAKVDIIGIELPLAGH